MTTTPPAVRSPALPPAVALRQPFVLWRYRLPYDVDGAGIHLHELRSGWTPHGTLGAATCPGVVVTLGGAEDV